MRLFDRPLCVPPRGLHEVLQQEAECGKYQSATQNRHRPRFSDTVVQTRSPGTNPSLKVMSRKLIAQHLVAMRCEKISSTLQRLVIPG